MTSENHKTNETETASSYYDKYQRLSDEEWARQDYIRRKKSRDDYLFKKIRLLERQFEQMRLKSLYNDTEKRLIDLRNQLLNREIEPDDWKIQQLNDDEQQLNMKIQQCDSMIEQIDAELKKYPT